MPGFWKEEVFGIFLDGWTGKIINIQNYIISGLKWWSDFVVSKPSCEMSLRVLGGHIFEFIVWPIWTHISML